MKSLLGVALFAVLGGSAVEGPWDIETPAPIRDLIYARPFSLQKGYAFEWRKERPVLESGVIVVIEVEKERLRPRQLAEPVLFAGDGTAERVNVGQGSGRLVAVIPGPVDLSKSPIWFGKPGLPEAVDAPAIRAERTRAEASGIAPLSREKIETAQSRGGAPLVLADRDALSRELGRLVETFAPDEVELARSLRETGTTSGH